MWSESVMTDHLTLAIEPAPILSVTTSTALSVPLDQNPASVYLASLSDGSQRTMRTALNTIGELLGVGAHLDSDNRDMRCLAVAWGALRYQHTEAIRTALQDRYAPATANKLLVALRRVLKEARRLGQISADHYERAVDLRTIPAKRLSRGRLLADAEVTALMRDCANDPTPAGARDAAIIALLRGTGLRRSEVVALDLADYDSETGTLKIRNVKGQKDRQTYVANGPKAALDEWLGVRGAAPGPLFYGVTRSGGLVVRRLAGQAIAVICAARAIEAGIRAFTPHDMRRTFISGLLDSGADIATVGSMATRPPHSSASPSSANNARSALTSAALTGMLATVPAFYHQAARR